MKRGFSLTLVGVLLVTFCNAAQADNCSGIGDCYGTIASGIAVAAAIAVAAGLLFYFGPAIIAYGLEALGAAGEEGLVSLAGEYGAEAAGSEGLDAWSLRVIKGGDGFRGNIIEDLVAEQEYPRYVRIGQDFNGTGETFDVYEGTDIVSLKSTRSARFLKGLTEHIDTIEKQIGDLNAGTKGWLEDGEKFIGRLDIRIPANRPDLMEIYEDLKAYGEARGVPVTIKEFVQKVPIDKIIHYLKL